MIATSVGDFVNAECSDCGGGKVKVAHWGPCVPEATRGKFCDECWQLRVVMKESAADPKPLGYRKVAQHA